MPSGRVGIVLREWRSLRRKSQLQLALEANVSARHLSFIETGRANPSRDMVLQLATALDVPLRERNQLLAAAGFTAAYTEVDLEAPELAPVRHAVNLLLEKHEPDPAVVMDRLWNIRRTNEGARHLFSRLIDLRCVPQPANVLHLIFSPTALRPFVENWEEVARGLLARVHREAVCGVMDAALMALLDDLKTYPEIPTSSPRAAVTERLLPVIPVRFRKEGFRADYFSTVTTLGTPQDVTAQELRIECFFPLSSEAQG